MIDRQTVQLSPEQETLLITLYSRAIDNDQQSPLLPDPYARQVLERIDYNYKSLKVSHGTRLTLVIRARQFDIYARQFIKRHPKANILHLGCGLDSRYFRLKDSGLDLKKIHWYDLDLPPVIKLRRKFYPETEKYQTITSSAQDISWTEVVKDHLLPTLVIAEGLCMYLSEGENQALLLHLNETFNKCEIVFDAYSTMTARSAKQHPSVRKTGATLKWGIDDPHEIETWTPGISLINEWFFDQSDVFHRLSVSDRLIFRLTGLFPFIRRAHRILHYSLR